MAAPLVHVGLHVSLIALLQFYLLLLISAADRTALTFVNQVPRRSGVIADA